MPRRDGWDKSGFGERMRDLRDAAGLSQSALAAMVGCAANTIARIEQEKHEPTWPLVLLIASALGATPNDFVPPAEGGVVRAKRSRGRPGKESR